MTQYSYINYNLRNPKLFHIADSFCKRWEKLRALLEQHSYIPTTVETYKAAQAVIRNPQWDQFDYLEGREVDLDTFPFVKQLLSEEAITMVMLDYSCLNFNICYFKERDKEFVSEVECRTGQPFQRGEAEDMRNVLDMLYHLTITENDSTFCEKVEDAIELMAAISEFVEISNRDIREVNRIMKMYTDRADRELAEKSQKMVHADYAKLRERKMNDIRSLTERFHNSLDVMLNTIYN